MSVTLGCGGRRNTEVTRNLAGICDLNVKWQFSFGFRGRNKESNMY